MTRSKSKTKGKTRAGTSPPAPLPDKQQILDFIQSAKGKVGKREIGRAFGLRGGQKIELKRLLKEMAEEGLIASPRKHIRPLGQLPATTVIEVIDHDRYGELIGVPTRWDELSEGPLPRVLISPMGRKQGATAAPGIGDRLLVRISPLKGEAAEGLRWQARVIKNLGVKKQPRKALGVFREDRNGSGRIEPIDRKAMKEWLIPQAERGGAQSGELVEFEPLPRQRRFGLPQARITKRLGHPEDERQLSLIAIHRHQIPLEFPATVLAELDALPEPSLTGRTDLREVPFITIDPPDARDHDDAIFAKADPDPENPGGHIIMVAIADVAHYVRPHSELDREALKRGNSVYFPDRVVPMLPERLSADLCSLKAGEERPCLVVQMVFDKAGQKKSHHFMRAMIRSHAGLNYQQAQKAIDGHPDALTAPLLEPVLKPLWAAYQTLAQARGKRGPLELDLPERKIHLGDDGHVERISIPPRLTAHRLVEEFMIQANVSAAETLVAKNSPLIYRVHDAPSREKVRSLSDFLQSLDLQLPRKGVLLPEHFNRILGQAQGREFEQLVNETILRAQSQAEYSPENLGHFGLNLRHYAHFTSPIRRYADLVVHRALIRALKLPTNGGGYDGLPQIDPEQLAAIAKAISDTERRAMAAERETIDRLIAYYLAEQVGAHFTGRISGVTRAGLFVRLDETGADGFIPARTMGDDYFVYDEDRQALVGKWSGAAYRLGDPVEVRLAEAIPTAGALRFELLTAGKIEPFQPRRKAKSGGSRNRAKRRRSH